MAWWTTLPGTSRILRNLRQYTLQFLCIAHYVRQYILTEHLRRLLIRWKKLREVRSREHVWISDDSYHNRCYNYFSNTGTSGDINQQNAQYTKHATWALYHKTGHGQQWKFNYVQDAQDKKRLRITKMRTKNEQCRLLFKSGKLVNIVANMYLIWATAQRWWRKQLAQWPHNMFICRKR